MLGLKYKYNNLTTNTECWIEFKIIGVLEWCPWKSIHKTSLNLDFTSILAIQLNSIGISWIFRSILGLTHLLVDLECEERDLFLYVPISRVSSFLLSK